MRVSRICSQAEDFRKHTTEIRSWFYKRGYPKGLVEKKMGKVKFSGYTRRNKRENKGVLFVITYHLSLKNIGRIFRNARKLSSQGKTLPLERTIDLVQCKGKRCQTCHNVKETETFTSTTTGKTFKINHKLNCNDKCLIYLLTCNVCLKQYVGQTVEKFRFRWNNYKNNDRNYQEYGTCMQQHLFEHVSITLIDKTDPSNLLQRKNYCRSILKAMTL